MGIFYGVVNTNANLTYISCFTRRELTEANYNKYILGGREGRLLRFEIRDSRFRRDYSDNGYTYDT